MTFILILAGIGTTFLFGCLAAFTYALSSKGSASAWARRQVYRDIEQRLRWTPVWTRIAEGWSVSITETEGRITVIRKDLMYAYTAALNEADTYYFTNRKRRPDERPPTPGYDMPQKFDEDDNHEED